jgi:hypothetical protein
MMKLSTDVITVYNKYTDPTTRFQKYIPTVIKNIHWFGEQQVNVISTGLYEADKYTIRVPIDADFGGKEYVTPKTYERSTDRTNQFTFAEGDVIVHGEHVVENAKPAMLQEEFDDVVIVLSITDNSKAPNAQHWKVVCK